MKTDLFRNEDIQELRDKIDKIDKSTTQVRKGLFSRHTALEKFMIELRDQIEIQDKEILKLKQYLYDEKQYLEIVK